MAKEKFILVSLKEDESKKLAQIVSNDTSRKILDYLADKESTESELAEKLGIPISTVHYNLQALVKGRLVEAEEYHYSEKGKEVLHYKLANKYIIIAPKSTFGIKEKLKRILPVALIALIGSFAFLLADIIKKPFLQIASADMMAKGAAETANAPMLAQIAEERALDYAPVAMDTGISFWHTLMQNPALWFLFGCVFTLIVLIIVEFIIYKRQK